MPEFDRIGTRLRSVLESKPGPGADLVAESDRRREAGDRYRQTARLQLLVNHLLIPHHEQFASRFATGKGDVYWSRFDEALRDSWTNALALRRSEFVEELLIHRKMASSSLPWRIETDDPKDPDQIKIAEQITKMIDAIPRYQAMLLYLAEAIWYGKYAAQVQWGTVMIDGKPWTTIVDHEPVDGDSIVYKHDKTPGILVRRGWDFPNAHDQQYMQPAPKQSWMQVTDRATALFLYDQFWRDHFIISNFQPSSADFLFEGEKAAGIFGVGLRSRLYFALQLRDEIRSWRYEAMQRIGANGMLYGYFQSGNDESMAAVLRSLQLLLRDNITAFPVAEGETPQKLEHIEPSNVGYDEMDKWVTELEECCRRIVVGQSLSSQAEATGMGSEVAELHRSTFEHYIRYDANNSQETLTRDLIQPMIRFNQWEYKGQKLRGYLPFRCRLKYSLDKSNVEERSQVIFGMYDRGIPLDVEEVYDQLGASPPKSAENILVKPQQAPAQPGQPGDQPPPGGVPIAGQDDGTQAGANGQPNGDGAALGMPGVPPGAAGMPPAAANGAPTTGNGNGNGNGYTGNGHAPGAPGPGSPAPLVPKPQSPTQHGPPRFELRRHPKTGGLLLHHADPARRAAAMRAWQTRRAKMNGAPR